MDNNVKFMEKYLRDSFEVREKVSTSLDVLAQVAMVAELILQVYINGGKVLIAVMVGVQRTPSILRPNL